MSESLYLCGVLFKAFEGVKCWQCPRADKQGKGIHAIRAQDLADYLKKRPFAGCPVAQDFSGNDFEANVSGRTGIIFFKDYWQRIGETGRTGDHIDLWNKNELVSIGFVLTWIRRTFSTFSENYLDMSDLRRSQVVSFWEIP